MTKFINFLKAVYAFMKGKKTYIIGGLMVLLGYLTKNNEMILEGLGFITMRAGIKSALQAFLMQGK